MIPLGLVRLLGGRAADVKVVHPVETVNARNDVVRDYGPDAQREPLAWNITTPGASQEVWGDRDMTEVTWTVLAPVDAPIGEHDALEVDGEPFQVDGRPLRWHSPTGQLDHLAIALTDWRS